MNNNQFNNNGQNPFLPNINGGNAPINNQNNQRIPYNNQYKPVQNQNNFQNNRQEVLDNKSFISNNTDYDDDYDDYDDYNESDDNYEDNYDDEYIDEYNDDIYPKQNQAPDKSDFFNYNNQSRKNFSNNNTKYNVPEQGWISKHKLGFTLILSSSLILITLLVISTLYITDKFPQLKGTPIANVLDKFTSKIDSVIPIEDDDVPVSSSVIDNVVEAPVDDVNDPEQQQHTDVDTSSVGEAVTASDIRKSVKPYETSGVSIGIDVSKWQGTINWDSVAQTGIDYAMIRIGYRTSNSGVIFEDPFAKYNLQEAQNAGIKIGVYFFSTALTEQEAAEEAAWTCKLISKYKITYPVVFDYECYDKSESRNYNLDTSTKTNIATKFLKYVEDQGYSGMLYSSTSGLTGDFDTSSISNSYKIWIAQYPATSYPKKSDPDYSGTYDMWQYTANGTVKGITGTVDLNVAKFGYTKEASAKDSSAPEKVVLDPEIGISFTEVDETVTPKIEVNLREKPSALEESKIVATLKNGETFKKAAEGSNGWSRVIYNDQIVYAVTSFLTTDLDDKSQVDTINQIEGYTQVNEQVTAKDTVNLRTAPDQSSKNTIVTSIKNGTYVKRTGVGTNGWSQLEYNGKTVYAITSYLEVKK